MEHKKEVKVPFSRHVLVSVPTSPSSPCAATGEYWRSSDVRAGARGRWISEAFGGEQRWEVPGCSPQHGGIAGDAANRCKEQESMTRGSWYWR